jgi:ATP-dependent protease ClpP protease subunit
MERDFFMTPDQAKEWGLIDLIVVKNPTHSIPSHLQGGGSGRGA